MLSYSLSNTTTLHHLSYLMRRRHLDNTTFCVFPKRVTLKRETNHACELLTWIELFPHIKFPNI